jgi:hypothetical protein
MYRAFGRFEAVVDDLLTTWREIQVWKRDGFVDDETALFYLENIYEYALGKIHDWLKRFVFALEHPVNNTVVFTDLLEFDGTPDMTLLQAWMENSRPPGRRSRNSLFTFALGVAVDGWLFGGDDE